jgi:hypothetical protein
MRYFVRMNYVDNVPVTLYRFDSENLVEEMWSDSKWVDASNVIVESLFKSGELDEVSFGYAKDFIPQAFSRG